MSSILTLARKELRALFQSPIAMIFLGVFLVMTLFLFFTQARFFARNLADVRPLFEWLPLLLIFLVSAVTMRSWAEERKAGTLEVLLTLPVRSIDLVLGKFLAGMALVALALLFTAPLPITVALLGPMDWGPVLGGYVAAMLLASAYMAIGLCVSARTDNQVVALMVTLVIGGGLWLVGNEGITGFFSADTAELLRALGTGSRFESIERGVFDLRDVVYYASLTVFFLTLNGVFLGWERLDPRSAGGRTRSSALIATVALVGLNAVAANLWLAPVVRARIDLTSGRDYSVSDVTRKVIGSLDEPLRVRAFISERTHPMLSPLIPQVRDMLTEYEIAGDGKLQVEIGDPSADDELQAEVIEAYGLQSIPFGVADRSSQSVVNAYFHVVVVYGDKYEVLPFDQLIEVRSDATGVQVKLRNLEYDLTRAIKKVSQDFVTIEALVARLPEQAQISAFLTPSAIPPEFQGTADALRKVGQELAGVSGGKVRFVEQDPAADPELAVRLLNDQGIQPLAADLFATQRFYLHMLVQVGDHTERILPRGAMTEADVRKALEAAFRRTVPGQLKRLLLVTEEPKQKFNPELPPNLQIPPRPADYRGLQTIFGQTYDVARSELVDGFVPEDVDVVLVGKTGPFSPKQAYALDQFLMRGGAVIALAGRWRLEADRQGIKARQEAPGLFELLETWGVTVGDGLVMDDVNAPFPLPVQQKIPNGPTIQRMELIPYPFFPDLRGPSLDDTHPALSGIQSMTMPWASPLQLADPLDGRTATALVTSRPTSTLREGGNIEPDTVTAAGPTWASGPEAAARPLAVAITGRFPSAFADRPNPTVEGSSGADDSGRTLKASVAPGKLVVLGSSELASDLMLTLTQQVQLEQHEGNLQLVHNLIDWTVEDTDLLSIRTAGAFARTLAPLEEGETRAIEARTWLTVLLPVGFVVLLPRVRRRSRLPIPLPPEQEAA